MIYSTHPADFDGITIGLRLIETAVDLIALCDDQPSRKAELIQEAAHLLKDAWLAVQTAAGRALKAGEEEPEKVIIPEMPIEAAAEPELDLFGGEEER